MPYPRQQAQQPSDLEQLAQIMQFVQPFQQQHQQQVQQDQLMQYHQQQLQQSALEHAAQQEYQNRALAQTGQYQQGELAARQAALLQAAQHEENRAQRDALNQQLASTYQLAGIGQNAQAEHDRAQREALAQQLASTYHMASLGQTAQFHADELAGQKAAREQSALQFEKTLGLHQQSKLEGLVNHLATTGQTETPLFKASLAQLAPEVATNAAQLTQAERLAKLKGTLGTFIGAIQDPKTLGPAIASLKAGFPDVWDHPEIQGMLKQPAAPKIPYMNPWNPPDMSNEFVPSGWNGTSTSPAPQSFWEKYPTPFHANAAPFAGLYNALGGPSDPWRVRQPSESFK